MKTHRGLTTKKIRTSTFDAEMPEEYVQELPSQSIHLAIREAGLGSSTDLIQMLPKEKRQEILDLDLWEKDRLNEDNIWEWLSLSDDADVGEEHKLLSLVVGSMDLKLITLLISRYTTIVTAEEPTDMPPGPHFYTPDKGYTWIGISSEDEEIYRLTGKLLAFLFEKNAPIFYQLTALPDFTTPSELEENSYTEKQKRLEALGIPSKEWSFEIHKPISSTKLISEIVSREKDQGIRKKSDIKDLAAIEPLIYEQRLQGNLAALLSEISENSSKENQVEFEQELTLIMNAAIVRFEINYSNQEAILSLASQVKSTISLGIELLLEKSKEKQLSLSILELYQQLGLQALYRAGLSSLLEIRSRVVKIHDEQLEKSENSEAGKAIVAHLREPLPSLPAFFGEQGELLEENGVLETGVRYITTCKDLLSIDNYLSKLES